MIVDCSTCPVRSRACGECIVPLLLDARPGLPLDDEERRAVDVFAAAGLVTAHEALFARATPEPWRGRRVG